MSHSLAKQLLRFATLALTTLAGLQAAQAVTGTATSLKISSNGSVVGGISTPTTVVLTATVSASGTAVTPGQVKFCDNSINTHCTGTAYLGLAQLTAIGKATLPLRFGYGTHSLQAIFLGTKTYSASQSTATGFVQRWKPGAAISHITASSGTTSGSYDLSISLTGLKSISVPPAPTGAVSFLDTSNSNSVLAGGTLVTATPPSLTFAAPFQPATGANSTAIAVGDFNGDGIPDVAVANSTNSTITILLGTTSGVFQIKSVLSVPTAGTISLAAADVNNDGNLDIVAADGENYIYDYSGNGDGTFGGPLTVASFLKPKISGVADFNGDGNVDLAVLISNTDVYVFLGAGDGTFAFNGRDAVNGEFTSAAVADINGDGIPDVLASGPVVGPGVGSTSLQAELFVYLGNGDGTFQSAKLTALSGATYPETFNVVAPITVQDLRGNGKLDVAGALPNTSSTPEIGDVAVLLGNGDGTFESAVNYPAGLSPSYLTAADFNADGNQDLVVTNGVFHGTVSVLLGNGDGTFAAPQTFPVYVNPSYVVAQDLTGNGKPDLVVLNPPSNRISVLLNQWGTTATATANNVTIPGTGTHNIEAYFPGDANYRQATSATIPLTAP